MMCTGRMYQLSSDDYVYSSDDSTNVDEPKIDLAAKAQAIYELAKQVYQKPEMGNLPAGADDENDFCDIPPTPCYSTESCFEDLIKYPSNVPERQNRVRVVILLSITFFVQAFSREVCIPFFQPVPKELPQWSQPSLALFPIWTIIVGVFLTIPACVAINKYGIRICLLYSCAASTFGVFIRCLEIGNLTFMMHVSAVFLSTALVTVKPLTVTVSTCCFVTGERNLATGFLTSASMAGAAAGLLVKTVLHRPIIEKLYPQQAATSDATFSETFYLYLIYFSVNVACALLVFKEFPLEPNKPERCERFKEPSKSFLMQTIFKSIQNINLVYVALSYACSNALSWPWYQMVDFTFTGVGFPRHVGMDCRLWMIVHTCVLSLSFCWLADLMAGSNKRFGLLCHSLSLAFMICVVQKLCIENRPRGTSYFIFGVMYAFPMSWSTQSLLYELAADFAHPLPENMAVGLVCMFEMLCEHGIYFLLGVFPTFHLFWLHMFTFIAAVFSVLFIALLDGKKIHRHY